MGAASGMLTTGRESSPARPRLQQEDSTRVINRAAEENQMAGDPRTEQVTTPIEDAGGLRYCCQPIVEPRQFDPAVAPERARAIVAGGKKWVNGTQLSYHCFQPADAVGDSWKGKPSDIEAVRQAFAAWFGLGIGISFREVARAEEATLRIAFDQSAGSWSYVGRDNLAIRDPRQRTMNFGWPLDTPYGRDTAMHEIGHALGLEHEHQNPFAGITWNTDAVRRYFQGPPNNWDVKYIDFNILRQISPAEVKGSTWDPDSVMEYAFGAGLIIEPAAYRAGLQPKGGLSAADRDWIRQTYPGSAAQPARPTLAPGVAQNLQLGGGETRVFDFRPPETRSYRLQTTGSSDTVMVLFELTPAGNVQIAADDDSGTAANARIDAVLHAGRLYQVGVRLYYAGASAPTSLLIA
ncbi:MAG TPA: hypothetical protein DIT03_07755 [Candidatus Accumulibacter sp.]|nr:MAG: hypothetical protein AW07_03184 [Candidatus Accumulibacter sp. SK-11]HAY28582.1 hypothetical protein [Accumulibacter sp.]HCN68147.1 hypothetical protein [Accumulibacter sp.]